jgi:hypothetical protein
MPDLFRKSDFTMPAENAFAISKSDSTPLASTTRAIYVGGAGDVVAIMMGGQTVTFKAVPVGTMLFIRATHVKDATTATNLVGLY